MSTQTPPRGSRNSKRQQRKHIGPNSHQKQSNFLTTPPSSPPRDSSPSDGPKDLSNGPRKSARSKKGQDHNNKATGFNIKASEIPAAVSNHRHTSSQPNIHSPVQRKDSPHYAGPTFHASPAPSALPIPSFFSKSVPDSSAITATMESDNDSGESEGPDATPSKPKPAELAKPKSAEASTDPNQESSPLAFLFKAALDARQRPQISHDVSHRRGSVDTNTKDATRKPDNSNNGIFPLELEDSDRNRPTIGPSFATPYKDRMHALRSASVPSPPLADLDEEQRRAKAQALKHLLLNPQPQRPSSAASQPHSQSPDPSSRFRSGSQGPHWQNPNRTSSGPPTPVSFNPPNGRYNSPSAAYLRPDYHFAYSPSGDPGRFRAPSSTLRQGFSPSEITHQNGPLSHHHSNHSAGQLTYHETSSTCGPTSASSSPPRRASIAQPTPNSQKFDTRKMEDDLKRILKINVTSGMHPDEVQSSLA